MIQLTGTITYRDGHTQAIEVSQAEYAAWELWALRHNIPATPNQTPPMTMTRYLGYAAAMHMGGGERAKWPSYEDWQDNVSDVTLDADDAEAVKAFPPAASVG